MYRILAKYLYVFAKKHIYFIKYLHSFLYTFYTIEDIIVLGIFVIEKMTNYEV